MQTSQSLAVFGTQDLARRFGEHHRLTVRQRKRWWEIVLSFELKNAYEVYDQNQAPVLQGQELGSGFGSFLKRIFLGPLRPFDAQVVDFGSQQGVLRLHRPFRFFFHRLEVTTATGERIGAIERRWSWLRRVYVLQNGIGQEVANLFGPILRPWTFEIRVGENVRGLIQKRWSGFLKEAFTDADNFGVDMANLTDPQLRVLAFAATVLIDVVHFERSKGG
ncbi:MAG TPA: phospholipid scramblase-related protein [Polyangia bacterium]